ncbi:MAG: outer membrane protein transport protein [Polyangia bacterium]
MASGLALAASCPTMARAGGLEEPGIGVEAMGRGGAFAAKADDATALEYNIAGLARQRGTRVQIEGKLTLDHYQFERTGTYPGAADASAPWQGQAYPKIQSNPMGAAPFLAVTTDFNYFDRWTFAIGLNTPSSAAANRQYPSTVNGNWPAPNRYDATGVNLLVVYPMLAAAVRVTHWLDLGFALQTVYGHFDLHSTAYGDLGTSPTPENHQLDVPLHITTQAFTATGVLGIMVHPVDGLSFAANLRGPMNLDSSGHLTAIPSGTLPALDPGTAANPAKANVTFHLPWIARFGIRYAFKDAKHREQGDIEIDGTYEAWHNAEGAGDTLTSKAVGPYNVNALIVHHYKDTGSVRVGGAYNFWFDNASMLAIRAGVFYDSPATSDKWTRTDFNTLAKVGYTLGIGYKIRGVTINGAYNFISSSERLTADGRQQVINGLGGTTTGPPPNNTPEPIFNNGKYGGHTHVLFLGLTFNVDEIQRKNRVLRY